ncbi:MAG: DUF5615 family PIN-like protein [Pyrinomonadaceae bacterium]
MKFLVDAQLPPGLARWLSERGHVSQHVMDLGLDAANDSVIWDEALRSGLIIITKDEDFAERTARSIHGPVIVWLRLGNTTNRALFAWFEPRWDDIIELLELNHRLIEVK